MKDTEFAFAVAKIRANENKLLSDSFLEMLISSPDYSSALKMLEDIDYCEFSSEDVGSVLDSKLREAYDLVLEASPDVHCLDFLIVKNDFHNLKAALKCLVLDKDCSEYMIAPCIIDTDTVKDAISNKNFSLLPEFAAASVSYAYDVLMRTMDGQLVDIILDKAMLEAQILLATESKNAFCIDIAQRTAALYNIRSALRAIRTEKDANFYDMCLAKCSLFDISRLKDACLSGYDSFIEYISSTGVSEVCEYLKISDTAFEKHIDDMILSLVKNAKYTSFGIAPLLAYCFAVESETKNIRIILSCKKNEYTENEIRERVRESYV